MEVLNIDLYLYFHGRAYCILGNKVLQITTDFRTSLRYAYAEVMNVELQMSTRSA